MGAKSRGNFPHYPNPEHCCERCVFDSGEHSVWCPKRSGSKSWTATPSANATTLSGLNATSVKSRRCPGR